MCIDPGSFIDLVLHDRSSRLKLSTVSVAWIRWRRRAISPYKLYISNEIWCQCVGRLGSFRRENRGDDDAACGIAEWVHWQYCYFIWPTPEACPVVRLDTNRSFVAQLDTMLRIKYNKRTLYTAYIIYFFFSIRTHCSAY